MSSRDPSETTPVAQQPSVSSPVKDAEAPCCDATKKATCCEPQAKAACCGPAGAGKKGCC